MCHLLVGYIDPAVWLYGIKRDFAKLPLSFTQPECLVPLVCMQFKTKPGRWAGSFQNSSFGFQHWRRADTWFALIRRHAKMVAEDRTVERDFAENCQHIDTNISRQPCPTLASSSVYNQMALCGHSWLYKDPKYLHHFSDKSSGAASFFLNALLHIRNPNPISSHLLGLTSAGRFHCPHVGLEL